MNKIEKLTAAGFPMAVKHGVVLVDFFARWHGPCHKQGDLLNALVDSEKFPEEVKVTQLDVDEAPVIAAKFEVDVIPTLLIFLDGHVAGRIVGAADETQVMELFPGKGK